MSLFKRKWDDARRIKVLQKETKKYSRINASLEEAREKAEREEAKAELQIKRLLQKTKLAEAQARERRSKITKQNAEADVWKARYHKLSAMGSFLHPPKSRRRARRKTTRR